MAPTTRARAKVQAQRSRKRQSLPILGKVSKAVTAGCMANAEVPLSLRAFEACTDWEREDLIEANKKPGLEQHIVARRAIKRLQLRKVVPVREDRQSPPDVQTISDDTPLRPAYSPLTGAGLSTPSRGSPSTLPVRSPTAPPERDDVLAVANLPATLRLFIDLHGLFLKALDLTPIHNEPDKPADMEFILWTMSRMFLPTPTAVGLEDIKHMLALYEVMDTPHIMQGSPKEIPHRASPFKLTVSDCGKDKLFHIRYVGWPLWQYGAIVGREREPFSEKELQTKFKRDLVMLYHQSRTDQSLNFLNGYYSDFPQLADDSDGRTLIQRDCGAGINIQILQLSSSGNRVLDPQTAPLPNKEPEANDEKVIEIPTPRSGRAALQLRGASLLARLTAKSAYNGTYKGPTAAEMQRSHALGHVKKIVTILRMKQVSKQVQRRLAPDDDMYMTARNVSFSMKQLVSEIKDSINTAIEDQQVVLCLRILADELGDGWVQIVEHGSAGGLKTEFVVLKGFGPKASEIRRLYQKIE